ncbi:hypothetical protein FOZ63_016744, partial [Perkinsus olseni]
FFGLPFCTSRIPLRPCSLPPGRPEASDATYTGIPRPEDRQVPWSKFAILGLCPGDGGMDATAGAEAVVFAITNRYLHVRGDHYLAGKLIVGRRACRLLLPASVLHYVDDLQAAPMGVVLTLLGGQVILRLMTAMSSIPAATRAFLTRLANNQHLIRSFLRNTGKLLFTPLSLLAATIFTFVIAPLLLGLLLYCVL